MTNVRKILPEILHLKPPSAVSPAHGIVGKCEARKNSAMRAQAHDHASKKLIVMSGYI